MLASLYLNAQVFSGEVSQGGLSRGQARWQDAFDRANGLINSGRYSLDPNFFDVFEVDNENNPEHILTIQHLAETGLGNVFGNRALHYNSTPSGAWNGFSTLAENYQRFDGDPRQAMYLQGPQVNLITGEPIFERNNGPRLDFTLDFNQRTDRSQISITDASENSGARPNKFPPDPEESGAFSHGNDYPWFRLGEMYLIRAEAAFEMGQAGQALQDVNRIRQRAGADPLTSISRDLILRERLLELASEARRRQDLIRADESVSFGSGGGNLWTRAWSFKGQSEPFRVVYPIPQPQLNANPALTQNAGY